MFFKYVWNNFLHTQVEICIAMILAMPPTQNDSEINRDEDQEPVRENILITHVSVSLHTPHHTHTHAGNMRLLYFPSQLLQKCRLVQRILEAWSSNEKEQ